jgi:3-hydroxybutyryl-CoA dehydrogenase
MSRIETIAVLGAGLMGHGIAQVFAAAGHRVTVYDPQPASLATLHDRITANLADLGEDSSCITRIHATADLAETVADADFIFEAALEDLAIKQALFAEVEAAAKPDAILASNTSVMPITDIMRNLTQRGRALGTHWWNPPFLVPLVEVIGTQWTAPDAITRTINLLRAAGKTPVHVQKDVAGFIGNRLQHALWREAVALVEQGICTAADVDIVVKASFGRRLGVLGPLENADLVGTDLTLAIHRTVLPAINARPGPSPYLEQLVAAGRLGMKSGAGFHNWTTADIAALRHKIFTTLKAARQQDRTDPA